MDYLNYGLDDLMLVNNKIVIKKYYKPRPKYTEFHIKINNEKYDPMKALIDIWETNINNIIKINKSLDIILNIKKSMTKNMCIIYLFLNIKNNNLLNIRNIMELNNENNIRFEIDYISLFNFIPKLKYFDNGQIDNTSDEVQIYNYYLLIFNRLIESCNFINNIIDKFNEFKEDDDFYKCLKIFNHNLLNYFDSKNKIYINDIIP